LVGRVSCTDVLTVAATAGCARGRSQTIRRGKGEVWNLHVMSINARRSGLTGDVGEVVRPCQGRSRVVGTVVVVLLKDGFNVTETADVMSNNSAGSSRGGGRHLWQGAGG
jgi:hypothetical protein